MRIVDKVVTGKDLKLLARQYFKVLNPYDKKLALFDSKSPAFQLQALADKQKGKAYGVVLAHLKVNLKRLFTSTPKDLMLLHNELIGKLVGNEDINSKAYKDLVTPVFGANYSKFRSGAIGSIEKWFSSLGLGTCPYCNRNWVTRIGVWGAKSDRHLYDVDHYFPKGKYPHFALSFYNLIPGCTICNQRLKRAKVLDIKKYLHPYVDDMDAILKFEIPERSVDQFYSIDEDISIELKPRVGASVADVSRAKRTAKFFELDTLYSTHQDYGRELMQRRIVYSKGRIDELFALFGKDHFNTKEELVRMIMGNYVMAKDIHKRPLAKLTKDLAEQFGFHEKLGQP